MDFTFSEYLTEEWRPALGCTEPASIAYAAASAAAVLGEPVERVELLCDSRIFKNCYAVGIPHSGHKIGLRWTLAIGCQLPDPSLQLECFRQITPQILSRAAVLLDTGDVRVEVDPDRERLTIVCRLFGASHRALAVIDGDHTNLVQLERDGRSQALPANAHGSFGPGTDRGALRAALATRSLPELLALSRKCGAADRERLREGVELNLRIAEHGLKLFPERFAAAALDPLTRASRLVCAGVYARMWGEDFSVMSLAGSGNKGVVASVPLALRARELSLPPERLEDALALACLVTSATTHHLGTLSAVCGCSNAAGIGLAAALVALEDGAPEAISLALCNMVGNVTGMICDGAKIGCALKTMTSVDAAFRAASLALEGVGIPYSDGIVGRDGLESLEHLGRIATRGMRAVDAEILAIMQEKLADDGA